MLVVCFRTYRTAEETDRAYRGAPSSPAGLRESSLDHLQQQDPLLPLPDHAQGQGVQISGQLHAPTRATDKVQN